MDASAKCMIVDVDVSDVRLPDRGPSEDADALVGVAFEDSMQHAPRPARRAH